MKYAKKLPALLLALMLCVSLFSTAAFAEAEDEEAGVIALVEDSAPDAPEESSVPATSGQCGDDLYWSFDEATGTLTITGTGDMWNGTSSPWNLPNGLSEITSVSLPEGLTSIGDWAFGYCQSLTSVTIPAGVTYVGSFSFYECTALTEVTIPEGVSAIGSCAFTSCEELRRVSLPDSLNLIGDHAFEFCTALTEVTVPTGVAEIPEECFSGCSALTDVFLQDGVSAIGKMAFSYCENLTTLELSADLESIGEWAFYFCDSLSSIVIPQSVTGIGRDAFDGCSSLTSITIPASVTGIGKYAFTGCDSLQTIIFEGRAPGIGSDCFFAVTATAYYPADDATWTEDVRRDYGGKLAWIPYTGEPLINVFSDVQYGKYYYDAVLWAYYSGITKGTDDTHFGPNKTCTREQIVTFLWKACGSPEPASASNPFTDVKAGKYYYKAVLWAVEKGITSGVTADKFGVGRPCAREQAMTFLWKASGSPRPASTDNPFTDVKAGKYYYDAVLWAAENNITDGVGNGLFGVGRTCTRGQIVTFLYALMGN